MTFEPKWPSPRATFLTQLITWSIFFVIMAVAMPEPKHEVPVCPSVLDSLTASTGIPKNAAGFAFGIVAIGFLWWMSGLLAFVYTRWPRLWPTFRVMAGRAMGPQARRIGPAVMVGGVLFGYLLQLGCNVTG